MWLSYWKLARDPFGCGASVYVPTPTHDEAVARLVHAVETGQRSASLRARAGLGKSCVLARALAEVRSPARRVARAVSPIDGTGLFTTLAEALGARVPEGASRAVAWRALVQAVRLERLQRTQVVLAVDDIHLLATPSDAVDVACLLHVDSSPLARFTLLTVGRDDESSSRTAASWDVVVRLPPLTRDEAERIVLAKLAAAGRTDPTFTQRAFHRLHSVSEGVPRGLDRLGALALMAGAARGLEIITPEVIDGVARECVLPAA